MDTETRCIEQQAAVKAASLFFLPTHPHTQPPSCRACQPFFTLDPPSSEFLLALLGIILLLSNRQSKAEAGGRRPEAEHSTSAPPNQALRRIARVSVQRAWRSLPPPPKRIPPRLPATLLVLGLASNHAKAERFQGRHVRTTAPPKPHSLLFFRSARRPQKPPTTVSVVHPVLLLIMHCPPPRPFVTD